MTATVDQGRADHDSIDLAEFGYPQQLRRRLGAFASFAAGFSFVSILTTVFQLFAFGFAFGGPAFFWTWPLVFAGQLMVALVFADLAARYPLSGAIYQWARRLAGAVTGWSAGWLMLVGEIIATAAAAIALQVVLPTIWSGFQIVPGESALTSTSGATNAVLLGALLIAVTTIINAVGVRAMAVVNSVGVACELAGVALLVALLLANSERGPGVVTDTGAAGGDGYVWAFLASALMAAYVMYGFDSAAELSEETRDPRRTAPRAIIRALVASGVGGALLLVAALMAAPSLTDGRLSAEGLPYVLTGALGTGLGKALLVDVAIAVVVCTLAIQTAASRLMFSMARDGVLPFSSRLAKVNARTGAPVLPTVVIGVLAVALLAVNIGNAQIFTAITGASVCVVYVAYLLVTVPGLVARLRGGLAEAPAGTFSLGRFGLAVNLLAVGYGLAMAVNIAWPRAAVYDPDGGDPLLRWFPVLVLGGAALAGAAILAARRARPLTVAAAPAPAPAAEGSAS
ncbi:amino acid permease [Spirillospora sp. NPDC047279]|uniref:amino acid permease n=1 Tax=Spirillospora sp. NPDC047279 TaxID=3155478 RepID=UPI0033F50F9B